MFSLTIAPLFIFICLLAKVKYSLQVSISERLVAIDGADLFNATSDSSGLMRRDHVLSKRVTFNVQLNQLAGAYVAPVIIDNQRFNVVFDTGSSPIVVLGPDCVGCGNAAKYQPGANKPTGPAVPLLYGSGTVVGVPYGGKISINNGLTYASTQSEPFFSATSVPSIFPEYNLGGIIGMSVGPTSASTNIQPFYYSLFATNPGISPVFAFSLSAAGGTLTIGGDKMGQDVSNINKLTVIDNTHWTVGLSSVNLAGNNQNFASVASVLFDTGSTAIGAPQLGAAILFVAIPGSSIYKANQLFYTVPCGTMPDISFTFIGDPTPFVVPGISLERAIPGDNTNCQVLIRASPTLTSWQLGTPFLTTVYSRFTVSTASAPGNFVGLKRV